MIVDIIVGNFLLLETYIDSSEVSIFISYLPATAPTSCKAWGHKISIFNYNPEEEETSRNQPIESQNHKKKKKQKVNQIIYSLYKIKTKKIQRT